MPNSVSNIQPAASLLETYNPIKLVLTPIVYIAKKIYQLFQACLGYFNRIGTFPFGERQRSDVKRKVQEMYRGGCYDTHNRSGFDPKRLEKAFKVLECIGARRKEMRSKSGTKLDTMLVRYTDVVKKIEQNGGMICDSFPLEIDSIEHVGKNEIINGKKNENAVSKYVDLIIRNPDQNDEQQWANFCKDTLSKLGLKKVNVEIEGRVEEAYIAMEWGGVKNPTRPNRQLYLRCNAPTESMAMGKRDIMRHVLGCRGDVLCYDYPGSNKSKGIPSEGAYYLAGETLVEYAHHELGYKWTDIWAFGFCLGGAVAVHLATKLGLNLSVQNTFADLLGTYQQQIWPANKLAPLGIDAVKSKDCHIASKVCQDAFDSDKKLREAAKERKAGYAFIVNTKGDTTIGPYSHEKLAASALQVFERVVTNKYSCPLSGNGHSFDVLGDSLVFRQFVNLVVEKNQIEAARVEDLTRSSSLLAS